MRDDPVFSTGPEPEAQDGASGAPSWPAFCAVVEQRLSRREIEADARLVGSALSIQHALAADTPSASGPWTVPAALAAYATTVLLAPGLPEADALEQTASRVVEREGAQTAWLAFATLAVHRALWADGAPVRVKPWVERGAALAADASLPDPVRRGWLLAEAQYRFVSGGAFEAALHGAREVDRRVAPREVAAPSPEVYPFATDAPTGVADTSSAYDRWWTSLGATARALAAAEHRSAQAHATQAVSAAEETGLPAAIAWAAAAAALGAFVAEDARGVLARLGRCRNLARRHRLGLARALARAIGALAAARRGRHSRAAALARDAVRRMHALGAQRLPLLPDRLAAELAVLGTEASTDALEAQARPRVVIRTLGAFEVVRDGRTLAWPRKAPRRPLELLKALIAFGGRAVPVARLVEALWPEQDRSAQSFATALHRLRKILGDDVVRLSEGQLSLDPALAWVDAIALEERPENPAGYRGEFLPGEDAAWALGARERLRDRQRRSVGALAEAALEASDWRRAFDLCVTALEQDPLAEGLVQTALHACARGGLRSEAAAAYERCRRALADSLGLSPSPRTEELYRAAIRR